MSVLSGREEEWLARQGARLPLPVAVTHLLASCLVSIGPLSPVTPGMARRLPVGDREFLMLVLRRITLGDTVQAVMTCVSCSARMDVDLDLTEISLKEQPETVRHPSHRIEVEGRSVEFRLPTGADQEAVCGMTDVHAAAEVLYRRCLLNGEHAAFAFEDGTRALVETEMQALAAGVDLELDLTCPECKCSFVVPFDISAYFIQEMRVERLRLLREVHALAFYYHWSESEIMAFPRPRRRAYIDLLSGELGRAGTMGQGFAV